MLVAAMMLMTALTTATASAATPTSPCHSPVDRVTGQPWQPVTVTGVRIGNHEDASYDRVVVDLTAPLSEYKIQYVPQFFAGGSGDLVPLRGNAFPVRALACERSRRQRTQHSHYTSRPGGQLG